MVMSAFIYSMGCSSTKSQPQPIVSKPANSPSPSQQTVPTVPKLLSTRWTPSAGTTLIQGTAQLKPGARPWTHLWTDLRLTDSFELTVSGNDLDKVIIGVIESAEKGKTAGVKLIKGCEFDVFSYEGAGLMHTQYSEFSYNSEQWKLRPSDTVRVDIEAASVTFFKNGRKLYTHEDVPRSQLSAFISLGSEKIQVEVRS